ncbi:MAG: hypothetical protein HY371_11740, partial [Devosia nanyangense]|nr:hypothetical protein [Devosia nanyangense]
RAGPPVGDEPIFEMVAHPAVLGVHHREPAVPRDDLINWAQMGVTLIISLALVFFVMRPLVKRVLAPEDRAPLALPPSAEVEAGLPAVPDLPEEANPPTAAPWVNGAKAMGEAQLETLKSVGQLVDENPKQAALIVRDWLSSNSAAA